MVNDIVIADHAETSFQEFPLAGYFYHRKVVISMAIITMLGYGTHYIWHAREYFTYVQLAKLAASINHSLKDVDLTCEGLK